ncbi:MAG: ComEC/Rec2 family competence protein [Proteobacteria bacterium]|nr:ComEC/Rec2 family competence protein [Pseudomonadota bacterium]
MPWALTERLTDWLESERPQLVLWLPVFMAVGVASYYALRFEPPAWIGFSCTLILLVAWLLVARRRAGDRCTAARLVLAPLAAVAVGFSSAQWATAWALPQDAELPARAVIVDGTVAAVEPLPEGRRITVQRARLDDLSSPLARAVRIRLKRGDEAPLTTGDRIRVRALLRPPAPPAFPGAWDFQRAAWFTGLGASGYALAQVEVTARATTPLAERLVASLRETITQRILAVVPGAAGGISVSFMTGLALAIPAADYAAFKDSGLMHLLSVSGFHIAVVIGFGLAIARFGLALSEHASLFWPAKRLAALCGLLAGAAYTVLVGLQVPIIRSFAMASLVTISIFADRRVISTRSLALAAVVVLLLMPWELTGVSLQMSFSAVLALVAGYEALRPWLHRLNGRGWVRRGLAATAALTLSSLLAGTASAPYSAYQFGHVQVYFVLANMVAVPLTGIWVMPAGFVGLALMPLHLEWLALVPMGWGAEVILWIARKTAQLPYASISVPHMPLWGLCLFSIGLVWLGLWRTRMRLAGIPIMIIGLLSTFLNRPPDLLVSADARLIALRHAGIVYLQQAQGGARYTRESWSQFWAIDAFEPIPQLGDAASGDIRCVDGACLLRPYPDRPGALLARGAAKPPFCADVSVIVSAEPARRLCPKPWPRLVDRFTVWRDGSAAIWLETHGARVLTDREVRGDRPWVPPPPRPRTQAPSTLPPAALDPGILTHSSGPSGGSAAGEGRSDDASPGELQ